VIENKTHKVDIFLEYQWTIREGYDRTFLEIPRSVKMGEFICPQTEVEWTPKNVNGYLTYVDKDENKHPFVRSGNYMQSNRAIAQTKQVEPVQANDNDLDW